MFLKYSTGQIPPKKSKGKGSQGKKTTYTLMADVDVSEKSDSEPARKRTTSRRVVKKKVTFSIADNIIPDPDVALELCKSIRLTEAAEEEAARQVHVTHGRIPGPGGSSEGTGSIPGVPDKSPVISATSNEGTGTKPGVPDEEKVISKENVIQMTDDEETDDEFIHRDEQVNENDYEEMTNAEVEESRKGDAKIFDVAKADAEKIEEITDDAKKPEFPPTSSSLFVSSGFGDQFLKLSSDTSLVSIVKDT
uniref:Uncharacterized protein n=1 Tax=Tanacetum cinerariifolium TaxID=118510 RepID=A0A6L2LI86_TANCI|nr:hypothetical protein [Tanacetum cinerariifolium]